MGAIGYFQGISKVVSKDTVTFLIILLKSMIANPFGPHNKKELQMKLYSPPREPCKVNTTVLKADRAAQAGKEQTLLAVISQLAPKSAVVFTVKMWPDWTKPPPVSLLHQQT